MESLEERVAALEAKVQALVERIEQQDHPRVLIPADKLNRLCMPGRAGAMRPGSVTIMSNGGLGRSQSGDPPPEAA